MQMRSQEAELELAIAAQHGSWQGLSASIEADARTGVASQWVINILRLVRFFVTQESSIVEAAVFAATAATLWWFGDRAPKPKTISAR